MEGGFESGDVTTERRITRFVEVSILIEPVADGWRMAKELAFEWNVGHRVIEVHTTEPETIRIAADALAQNLISDAWAADRDQRNIRIGETAEGEQRERASQTMAGETDFGLRMVTAVPDDAVVHLCPNMVERALKSLMD